MEAERVNEYDAPDGAFNGASPRRASPAAAGDVPHVLIVDGNRLLAESLRSFLVAEGLSQVVVATTGIEARELLHRLRPDVVLVDIELPDATAVEVGNAVLESHPQAKIVLLADNPGIIGRATRAGFHGVLSNQVSPSDLVTAVWSVAAGDVVKMGSVRDRRGPRRSDDYGDLLGHQLTPREREILSLLVLGLSGKEIAKALSLRYATARTRVQTLLAKLQVHSRLEAANVAVRYGLVPTAEQRNAPVETPPAARAG